MAQHFPEEIKKTFQSSVRITGLQTQNGIDDQPNMEQKYRFVPFPFVP
jgi:hypothetical protein